MNKMMIGFSLMVSVLLFNGGISSRGQTGILDKARRQLVQTNGAMSRELRDKRKFVPKDPVNMDESFNSFVNLMRLLESHDGIVMDLTFASKGEKGGLEEHLADSGFRNVKALPVVLTINQSSSSPDPVSALNDVYVLEKQTDFKVNIITAEAGVLKVKGEIYGRL